MLRLRTAAGTLTDYASDFSDDKNLVEHEPVIIASFHAEHPDELAKTITTFLTANRSLGWSSPIGAEEAAFLARQPGGELPPELNVYRQVDH